MCELPLRGYAIAALKQLRGTTARVELEDFVFGNRRSLPMRKSKLLGRVLSVLYASFRLNGESLFYKVRAPKADNSCSNLAAARRQVGADFRIRLDTFFGLVGFGPPAHRRWLRR